MIEYLDVELVAEDSGLGEAVLTARVHARGGEAAGSSNHSLGQVNRVFDRLGDVAAELPHGKDRLVEFLGDVLFPNRVRDLLEETRLAAGGGALGIRMTAEEEILHLPWEFAGIPYLSDRDVPAGDRRSSPGLTHLCRHDDLLLIRRLGDRDLPLATLPARVTVVAATDVGGRYLMPDMSPREYSDISGWGNTLSAQLRSLSANPDLKVHAVTPQPTSRSSIEESLSRPTFGWCFFGHHDRQAGGLLVNDASVLPGGARQVEVIRAEELAPLLLAADTRIAIVAACDTAVVDHELNLSSFASVLTRAGVPIVIAMQGEVRSADAMLFVTRFFEQLTRSGDVATAFLEGRSRMAGDQRPLPALFSGTKDLRLLRGAVEPAATALPLAARRVPVDWAPADGGGPSDRHQARLDVLWTLDRNGFTGVLVDPPGADLVTSLNEIENLIAAVLRERDLPERRWVGIDGSAVEPDDGRLSSALRHDTTWRTFYKPQEQRSTGGIVVVTEVEHAHDGIDRLVRYAEVRNRLFPSAALVFQLRTPRTAAGLRVADRLGQHLVSTGAGSRCNVLVRSVPVPRAEDEPGPYDRHRSASGRAVLPALLAEIGRERAVQGFPPGVMFDGDGPQLPRVRPERLAEQVVEELNELDRNASSAMSSSAELRLLRSVRDLLPDYHRALLREFATGRARPRRALMLLVAADRDEDLTDWLELAGDQASDARTVPLELFDEETMTLVGLRLRKAGRPSAWAWLGPDAPLFKHIPVTPAAGAKAIEALLRDAPSQRVSTVVRAIGLRDGDFDGDPGGSLPRLAAISLSAVDETLVRRIGALSPAVQQLFGLVAYREAEPTTAEHLFWARQLLDPPEFSRGASDAG